MGVSAEKVRLLRERTQAGVMDCREALIHAHGDLEKAAEYLKQKGVAIAAKKATRTTQEGCIESYVHAGGKIGVLVEVNCETDFVARNDTFRQFVKDMAMQIAATAPQAVQSDTAPKEARLLEQPFIKKPEITVKDYLTEIIAKTGENVVIKRFVRYQLGEE